MVQISPSPVHIHGHRNGAGLCKWSRCCRVAELSSDDGQSLPGEIICIRLETGSTDAITSTRKQLGLQLVGRLPTEDKNMTGDDRPTSGNRPASGVFVAGVLPGSVAAVDGSIRVGDELLQVGDCMLSTISLQRVAVNTYDTQHFQWHGVSTTVSLCKEY